MSHKEKQDLAKINESKKQGEALAKPIIEKMNQVSRSHPTTRQSNTQNNARRLVFSK